MSERMVDLAQIRTFPQLVKYLRDELDWPIESDDFEDLTFDYTPEELGIDSKSAAKIQEIKRLRPLSVSQPWGVFFVKFEPKRLPVVALRRILSSVVLKKRASANRSERAAWDAEDLLFISNYGEGDARQITFAHFSQGPEKEDLPTLKVLGWHNLDTLLHIDDVAKTLSEHLVWPEDEADADTWRDNWRSAFTLRHREVITTSRDLSIRLAELARAIRDRIRTALAIETEAGPLTKLMKAFQEALVHDLDTDGFADMYAQTIAYGLLSARVTNPTANTADGFAVQLPVTNPFLKELMETFLHVGGRKGKVGRGPGIDFDELGVSEVVELLDHANMEAVVRDFGDLKPEEDPVTHFYELFLNEFDQEAKKRRGVFYTPRQVVSYIVRSVHELLQTEFGLADGLADTATWGEMAKRHASLTLPEGVKSTERFVTILDPATGTGTFLVEAIEVIHRTLTEKWKREGHGEKKLLDLWNEYVPKYLLPRLHGYELLMAPFAIAHLKIGLKLRETGYRFESDERARIYLTNALEPAHDFSGRFEFAIPALAHEAEAVNIVKKHRRFTVIVGNPPYSGISANNSDTAVRLVDAYKMVDGEALGERKLWLQDDYVKFLRFGQLRLDEAHAGTLGFVTNHGFLDNPTFRGMRQSMIDSFATLRFLDLHGNANKGEHGPDGRDEQNVFEIRQGVAVTLAAAPIAPSQSTVDHFEIWGARAEKYQWLAGHSGLSTPWTPIDPSPPYRFFAPRNQESIGEYNTYVAFETIVRDRTVGMITARDALTIHFTRAETLDTVERFASLSPEMARLDFGLGKDARDWSIKRAQEDLRSHGLSAEYLRPVLYRPFDVRMTFYTGTSRGFIGQPQKRIMAHLNGLDNWALCISRFNRQKSLGYFFATRVLTDFHLLDTVADSMTVFPLYSPAASDEQSSLALGGSQPTNMSTEFLATFANRLGIIKRHASGLPDGLAPEEIYNYAYAVFHSPGYRTRYAESIKIDFPRLPLTASLELFRQLARLGGDLVALHLVEAPAQQVLAPRYDTAAKAWRYEVAKGQRLPVTLSFNGPEKPVVGKVGWSDDTVWIDAVKPKKGAAEVKVTGTVGFHGVPEEVWNFHIGGYQVCEKWLKDRKDRTLTADDIAHYGRIVIALYETIRLMREIDEVIDQHGGWPGAFATERAD